MATVHIPSQEGEIPPQAVEMLAPITVPNAQASYREFRPVDVEPATPIVLIPGFLGTYKPYRDASMALAAEEGRSVFLMSLARTHGGVVFEAGATDSICRVMDDVLNTHDIGEADAIGHSMGAALAVEAAEKLQTDTVRSLVLVDPLGIYRRPWFIQWVDAARCLKGEVVPNSHKLINLGEHPLEPVMDIAHYLGRNVVRTAAEINYIWRANIAHRLAGLAMPVGVFAHRNDIIVPGDECVRRVENMVAATRCESGGHLELQLRPEQSAKTISDLLTEINQPRL